MILNTAEIKELIDFAITKRIDLYANVNHLKHMEHDELLATQGFEINGLVKIGYSDFKDGHAIGLSMTSVENSEIVYYFNWDELALCSDDFTFMLPVTDYAKARKLEFIESVINE